MVQRRCVMKVLLRVSRIRVCDGNNRNSAAATEMIVRVYEKYTRRGWGAKEWASGSSMFFCFMRFQNVLRCRLDSSVWKKHTLREECESPRSFPVIASCSNGSAGAVLPLCSFALGVPQFLWQRSPQNLPWLKQSCYQPSKASLTKKNLKDDHSKTLFQMPRKTRRRRRSRRSSSRSRSRSRLNRSKHFHEDSRVKPFFYVTHIHWKWQSHSTHRLSIVSLNIQHVHFW